MMIPALASPVPEQYEDHRPPIDPFISVIIPVRNEAAHIEKTLHQILHQHFDAKRFELMVIDGQSTDDTWAIVSNLQKAHDNLFLLTNPQRWSSAGRNVGVRAARGDIVVIIDGHCDLDNEDYLIHLAHAFERSGADCVGRPQPLDVPGANPFQQAIAIARSSRLGHHPDSFIYSDVESYVPPQSVAVAYRREVFDRVGLFDESFDACEDVEFNHRVAQAGFRCFFTPRVQVRYFPRENWRSLLRQMIRYGRGRMRLLLKHPDTATLGCMVPALLVGGLATGPIAWLSPWLLAPYLTGLTMYGLMVVGFSMALTWQAKNIRLFPWLPLVFVTVHVGAGLGLLQELFQGILKIGRGDHHIWSRVLLRPSSQPPQILAWRHRETSQVTEMLESSSKEPSADFPRSRAG
jgi:succinoglycan biosynthesis protein ExoA